MSDVYSIKTRDIPKIESFLREVGYRPKYIVTERQVQGKRLPVADFTVPGFETESLDDKLAKRWERLPIDCLGSEDTYYRNKV